MSNVDSMNMNIQNTPLSNSVPNLEMTTMNTDSGFFSFIQNISWSSWFILLIVLIFLGFNIFMYLAKGSDMIRDITNPILNMIFGTSIATTGQIVDVSAEGAKHVVKTTSNVIDSGLTETQHLAKKSKGQQLGSSNISEEVTPDNLSNTSLNKALNTSKMKEVQEQDYISNEAETKSGWCFIGQNKGVRTCTEIGENDKCMSGDIFPSQDICINPRLRE